jgi:hypothetical protein
MGRTILCIVCLAIGLPAIVTEALAQRDPHVGYVYPAGGQRGNEFHITVGGQYLEGTTGVRINGEGVEFTIVRHISALTRQRTNKIRQMLRALRLKELQEKQRTGEQTGNNTQQIDEEYKDVTAQAIVDSAIAKGYDVAELDDVKALTTQLFDPKRQENEQIGERVILKVKISKKASFGKRELRLETPQGLTNILAFQIGPYDECVEAEPNDKQPELGVPESLPVVLNGQVMPGDVDRFRFQASRGMRLVAAVSARVLVPFLADAVPGWFQATLKLLDSNGKQVAWCDDYRYSPDPVILYEVPADGEYVLEIADAIYRGREDFVYRIVLGEVPFMTGIYPLGGPGGEKTTVQLTGWNLPKNETTVDATDCFEGTLPVRLQDNNSMSNSLPFAVEEVTEIAENEPNNVVGEAREIELPQIVNGRIDTSGDWDVYSFHGSTGDDIVAEIFARRLASPLDCVMKLTDADGTLLKSVDDSEDISSGLNTHHADPRLLYTLPVDGTYLLHVGDVQSAGGRDYAYRLRVAPAQGDFLLRVAPANVNIAPGGTIEIMVHALRRGGFDGQIIIEMPDLPNGAILSGNRIPAGQEAVRMTLTMPRASKKRPQNIKPFTLNLVGRASINGVRVRQTAMPAEDQMQAFLWRHLVPVEEGIVTVAGQQRWVPSIRYTRMPLKLSVGGTARVEIRSFRGTAAERFELDLSDPPAGVSIKETFADPDKGVTIVLQADAVEAEPGTAGNLIFSIYQKRPTHDKNGKPRRGPRRVAIGVAPALPFNLVR